MSVSLVSPVVEVDMAALGQRIRASRERRGLSLVTLDQIVGVARGSMNRIEHGDRPELSVPVLARIASALDVSLDWLVWGKERG